MWREGATRNDGNERKSWLQEKRVRQKSKLLLWFRNAVTKYSLSFIGSVEIFILVPS